jgi:large subunit ribosomal protein L10e
MPLRPGRILKNAKRPWSRVSKSKPRKSYVVGVPFPKINQFEMGSKTAKFDTIMYLVSLDDVQMRDNAMEAARIVTHKFLEKKLGPTGYFYKVLVYPHNVIREHSIATGAGADRFSQGMRHNFGRPVGKDAIVKAGHRISMLRIDKINLQVGKEALVKASKKIRPHTRIDVIEAS